MNFNLPLRDLLDVDRSLPLSLLACLVGRFGRSLVKGFRHSSQCWVKTK